MAGERKGKTYEAIVKHALEVLAGRGSVVGSVFWNSKAAGMTVTPDFTIGPDSDHPSVVLLVTHSNSAGDSHKKGWRNLGELAECKLRLKTIPSVYAIVFDSLIKENLKKIGAAAFDGQLIVGDQAYGPGLVRWIDANHPKLVIDAQKKAAQIARLVEKGDEALKYVFNPFLKDLENLLKKREVSLDSLWKSDRARPVANAPKARITSVRRGLSKLLIFEDLDLALRIYRRERVPLSDVPQYAFDLKLAGKSIGRASAVDHEIRGAVDLLTDSEIKEIISSFDIGKIGGWLTALRNAPHLAFVGAYVVSEYSNLCDPGILHERLNRLHADPWALIDRAKVPRNWPPSTVWLLEYLIELIKTTSELANGYGYAQLARDVADPNGPAKSFEKDIRDFLLSPWGHLSEWIHRVPKTQIPPKVIQSIARVLAARLRALSLSAAKGNQDGIAKGFVTNLLESKLCTYSGFDPLGLLLKSSVSEFVDIRVAGCFAEKAGLAGSAGVIHLGKVKSTLINWQSATDSGKDHKVKELCGRAVALRHMWEGAREQFVLRPGVRKLCLVLDGTWTQQDLDTLVRAGWDEIFYPDEIDKLVRAIV
jgi:hypothetical protein